MLSLGINVSGHDSAAALVRNGELLFAAPEERFTRRKADPDFPTEAISAGLGFIGATLDDVDAVGVSFPLDSLVMLNRLRLLLRGKVRFCRHNATDPFIGTVYRRPVRLAMSGLGKPATWWSHHMSHALWGAVTSGAEDCAILVMDEQGGRSATTIWHFRDGTLRLRRRIDFPNSLGLFYAAITGYLGFEPFSDEWKVMGLAAYGGAGVDAGPLIEVTRDGYRVAGKGLLGRHPNDYSLLESLYGPRRRVGEPLTDRHRDIAHAAQAATEQAVLALARAAHDLTGSSSLCVVGGVALNCKANGLLLEQGPFGAVFAPPAAADDGSAAGAAYAAQYRLGPYPNCGPLRDSRLGTQWSGGEIEQVLANCGLRYRRLDDPEDTIAAHLAEGRIVARFRGRAEFGARALGARSILAHPGDAGMRDRVNAAVKYREDWRPFAPVVLAEAGNDYFRDFRSSPFMTLTFQALPSALERAPAVVHADGTARLQSVTAADDPALWRVLSRFAELTGLPILLNTSFNLRGEPIVDSPRDALRTFYTSGLEILVMEDFEIIK
jgi:carbamoyltransferase